MLAENWRNQKRKRSCQKRKNQRKKKLISKAQIAALIVALIVVKVTAILAVPVQKKKRGKKAGRIKLRKNRNQVVVRNVNINRKSEMKKKITNTSRIPVQVIKVEKED